MTDLLDLFYRQIVYRNKKKKLLICGKSSQKSIVFVTCTRINNFNYRCVPRNLNKNRYIQHSCVQLVQFDWVPDSFRDHLNEYNCKPILVNDSPLRDTNNYSPLRDSITTSIFLLAGMIVTMDRKTISFFFFLARLFNRFLFSSKKCYKPFLKK